MNILIPMAGAGSRFKKVGYRKPKPLIDVSGKPMIQRVIENINLPEHNHIFIMQKAHSENNPEIKQFLSRSVKNSTVVEIEGLTEGAACTTLLARKYINNDEELLIANADQWVDWNSKHFLQYSQKFDGVIPYFLSDSPKHSYSKINFQTKLVTQVAEKQVISNLATVGLYYWNSGKTYVECAESMIAKNIRFNNEFYICPVYNELIHQLNGDVSLYPVYEMRGMGTPEELELFLTKLNHGDNNKL